MSSASDHKVRKEGQSCNHFYEKHYPHYVLNGHLDYTKYLLCSVNNVLVVAQCPTALGTDYVFDYTLQRCLPSNRRNKRQTIGSGRVGDICNQNIDCVTQTSMYCLNGLCACLSNYVASNDQCLSKVNPGQSGCTSAEQCTSVWPGTTCSNGICVCTGTNQFVQGTPDGTLCLRAGSCPLPDPSSSAGGTTPVNPNQVQMWVSGAAAGVSCVPSNGITSCTVTSGTLTQDVRDLYDCLPTTSGGTTTGLCCPNRAYTCTLSPIRYQSTSVGPALTTATQNRYFFNSITGDCQIMTYSDAAASGNSNNFLTYDQCISYCQTSCPRGVFQYDGTTYTSNRVSCASASCTTDYTCTVIGSNSFCCMKTSNICAPRGGLTVTYTAGTTFLGIQRQFNLNADGTTAATTVTRYRYNQTSRICSAYQWYQQGGDYNNFQSQDECESFCSAVLCTYGEPIKDANSQNVACGNSNACPASHQCTNSVCCPRAQTVCAMPQRAGTCSGSSNKYWFNAYTKSCEIFAYTGCQGNANRFDTLLTCQEYCTDTEAQPQCIQGEAYREPSTGKYVTGCSLTNQASRNNRCPVNYECYYDGRIYGCCPTRAYVCSQSSSDNGQVCGPSITRWYFDFTDQVCQTFTYRGCGGHPNTFVSKELCETYCGVGGCPYGGDAFREGTGSYRLCGGTNTCPNGYDCTQVTIGGNTANRCCLTRSQICNSQSTSGGRCLGSDSIQRWYFVATSRVCRVFTFNGCNSNGNNFATKAQCEDFCQSSACELGETVFINPTNQNVQTCNVAINNTCPALYRCVSDRLVNNFVCCGSTSAGVCQAGARAFMNPLTNEARACIPSIGLEGGCPGSYSCALSQNRGLTSSNALSGYFCCISSSGSKCPLGKVLYESRTNGQVTEQTCVLGNLINNECSSGYSCQSATTNAPSGYCCSIAFACASGLDYEKTNNDQPKTCTVGLTVTGCSNNFICTPSPVLSALNSLGYCCGTAGANVPVCGAGRSPYLNNGQPTNCALGQINACNNGFRCTASPTAVNTYYCCSPSLQEVCQANGQQAELDTSTQGPRICTSGSLSQCGVGYNCVLYAGNRQFYCCGSPVNNADGCNPGLVGKALNGQTQSCTGPGDSGCGAGYSCQYSAQRNRWQCCGQRGNCPIGSVAQINQVGSGEVICNSPGGIGGCSFGFTCTTTTGGNICCTSLGGQQTPVIPQAICPRGMVPQTDILGNSATCSSCANGFTCQQAGSTSICCPTQPATVCTQRVEPGSSCAGTTSSTRYFYNPNSRGCEAFTYNGCRGNSNNFFTSQSCTSFCRTPTTPAPTSECPNQSEQAARFSSGTFQTCNRNAPNCAVGYTCQRSPQLNYDVCCGNTPSIPQVLRCPTGGQQAFQNAGTNIVLTCSLSTGIFGGSFGCPTGYSCQLAAGTINSFICCGQTVTLNPQTCSSGSNVYIEPGTTGPKVCTGAPTVCPSGYQCTYSTSLRQFYCCSIRSDTVNRQTLGGSGGCPAGAPLIYQATNSPLACPSAGSTACPTGFACLQSAVDSNNFICCSRSLAGKNLYHMNDATDDFVFAGFVEDLSNN